MAGTRPVSESGLGYQALGGLEATFAEAFLAFHAQRRLRISMDGNARAVHRLRARRPDGRRSRGTGTGDTRAGSRWLLMDGDR